MSRPPKFFFPGGIYFFTTSAEQGFMFPPNELVREVIYKCLAQAQGLHKIHILDIIVQPTHIHLIVQILDPQDASDFMERFKTETAHALNRLLGRTQKTVWCEGYDSPLIPDLTTAIDRIAYIYANPSNDDGEEYIERFPGFNTFMLRAEMASGKRACENVNFDTFYIARSDFTPITKHTPDSYLEYRNRLVESKKVNYFTVSPNALFRRFGFTTHEDFRRLNQAIVTEVRMREERNRARRAAEGKSVIGADRLRATAIGADYVPKRSGMRMRTHCKDKELRLHTLAWMRLLIDRRNAVRERRRLGDYSVRYPIGVFAPSEFRLAEPLGW